MTKHDDNFRRFERMAKSAKKNLSGDKPSSCSRCVCTIARILRQYRIIKQVICE